MLWIPDAPNAAVESSVRLYPEPVVPLEQALLTCISMVGVGMAAWYVVTRLTGW
ncbi:MAG TPA: hypothetical protein VGM96_21620 [Reyranella sp.]|jgi:hypothetical protein